jgi:hypothetical protein
MALTTGFLTDIEARKRILTQIINRPRNVKGNLDYAAAFTDHPEWPEQLGWSSGLQRGRAYAMASAMVNGKTSKKEQMQAASANGNGNGNGNGHAARLIHAKSKLTETEVRRILEFINANRKTYANNQACFGAALAATGCAGKLINNSGATARYFSKAEAYARQAAPAPAVESVEEEQEQPAARRKYTKQPKQEEAHEVRVNYCPQCGCNIHKVAMGMAMAHL